MAAGPLDDGFALTASDVQPVVLRRADGQTLGCAVIVLGAATLAFGWAAIDPDFAAKLQDGRAFSRGASMTRSLGVAQFGSFNLGFCFAAIGLAALTWRFGRRSVDDVFVSAEEDGLRFHRSVKLPPLAWSEIADLWFDRTLKSHTLTIGVRNGQPRQVKGIDRDQDAVDAFVSAARNRLAAIPRF